MAAFINSERKWDDAIVRFLGEAIDQAFPNADLPATISHSSFRIPACDAILYEVGTDFELAEGLTSLSFIFNTGDGGLRPIDAPVPPPSIKQHPPHLRGRRGRRAPLGCGYEHLVPSHACHIALLISAFPVRSKARREPHGPLLQQPRKRAQHRIRPQMPTLRLHGRRAV